MLKKNPDTLHYGFVHIKCTWTHCHYILLRTERCPDVTPLITVSGHNLNQARLFVLSFCMESVTCYRVGTNRQQCCNCHPLTASQPNDIRLLKLLRGCFQKKQETSNNTKRTTLHYPLVSCSNHCTWVATKIVDTLFWPQGFGHMLVKKVLEEAISLSLSIVIWRGIRSHQLCRMKVMNSYGKLMFHSKKWGYTMLYY